MFIFRSPPPLLLLIITLASLCGRGLAGNRNPVTAAITTAPIYLPSWTAESWSLVRGSIIDVDTAAHHTTYTIFCPDEDPPACDISLEFPFVLVEGPDTVEFHGTYTSTYIADLECRLNGTTAATCSGYSSFKKGYTNGLHTGPTEISWTSTLTGSQVQWGVLTMAEKPRMTDDSWDITATPLETPTTGSSLSIPIETGIDEHNAGTRLGGIAWVAVAGAVACSLVVWAS